MNCLLQLPSTEARALLDSGAPVFVPVNPVEYHGPHLSLHNDALICGGLIRDLHARLAADAGAPGLPLLQVRELAVGVDPVPGPGSRPFSYAAVKRTVRAACEALAARGARRLVLMTFHGSPLHNLALEHAARQLRRQGVMVAAPFHAVLQQLITLDGAEHPAAFTELEPAQRAELMQQVDHDFHAGFMETSLALHYAPGSVDPAYTELPPCPTPRPARSMAALARGAAALGRGALARELRFAAAALGWYAVRPFPGYTGCPHLAQPRFGRYLAEQLTALQHQVVSQALGGAAPLRPALGWVRAVTLGGRLTAPR